jgi:hypothetical protein
MLDRDLNRVGPAAARGLMAARVPTDVHQPRRVTIYRQTARAECASIHGSRN